MFGIKTLVKTLKNGKTKLVNFEFKLCLDPYNFLLRFRIRVYRTFKICVFIFILIKALIRNLIERHSLFFYLTISALPS